MKIGKELHTIRVKKNITKIELCKRTGFNKGYVYRLENDLISPTITTLEKVARALEVPLWEIVKSAELATKAVGYASIADDGTEWGAIAESGQKSKPYGEGHERKKS